MPLDGVFLRHIKKELSEELIGFHIDKVFQPSREELVLIMRNRKETKKMLISSRSQGARVHITRYNIENPSTPPMFCMLLRKKIESSKLINIRQPKLERVLFFDFDCVDEMGEEQILTLAVEMIGKCNNVILIDQNNRVIDALKRISADNSSSRIMLPGVEYVLPPAQGKACILDCDIVQIASIIFKHQQSKTISEVLLDTLQGFSPLICREIEFEINHTDKEEETTHDTTARVLKDFFDIVKNISGSPYVIEGTVKDFTFRSIRQYSNIQTVIKQSFSELLDDFFYEKDSKERLRAKTQKITKKLKNVYNRLEKKISIQKQELIQCSNRGKVKMIADILNANLYKIKKGEEYVELENFYDGENALIKIKLDPRLSPSKNAQQHYKKYKKFTIAESILKVEIEKSEAEMRYVEAVIDEIDRATTEEDLNEIKEELVSQGYITLPHKKKKTVKTIMLQQALSSDGLKILYGKNNRQNDYLTFKCSSKNDLWFHAKDVPGAHVVVKDEGKGVPPEATILEAAKIAAKNSKSKHSSKVDVDYTQIKNVSKPKGAKPGMVIYTNYFTVSINI